MKLRFLNGRFQGRVLDLKPDGFTAGRGPDNDLVIDEDGISRRHCLIACKGGQYVVEDLQSTNGVRVNGRRITDREAVKCGDHVGLGPYVLLVTDTGEIVDTNQITGAAAAAETTAPAIGPERKSTVTIRVEKASFPWIQSVILGILCIAFAVLAYKTLVPGSGGVARDVAGAPPAAGGDEHVGTAGTGLKDGPEPAAVPVVAQVPAAKPGTVAGEGPSTPAGAAPQEAVAGMLAILTEPSGATIKIDGADRGTSPLLLKELSGGRHTITLSLSGYEEMTRQIHYPALIPDKPYQMRQKPGTLLVTSAPAGATVQYGPRILGQTPLLLDDLPPGEYELRIVSFAHDVARVQAKVDPIRPEAVHAVLRSRAGNLEVVTFPAGCDVYVDEALVGRSVAQSADARDAKPLQIPCLVEGEHDVRVQHPLGAVTHGKAQVIRDETRRISLRVWVLDTEVVMNDGTRRYGMLIEKNQFGDLVLAESSKRLERYLKPQIQKVNELTLDQSKELLEKLHLGGLRATSKPAPPVESEDVPAAGATKPTPAPAPAPGVKDKAAKTDAADAADDTDVTTADTLANLLHASTATDLKQRYPGRTLTVSGVPATFGKDSNTGYVTFGTRLRFLFARADYEKIKDRVRDARESRASLTIKGTVEDVSGGGLVFKDCAVTE